MFFFDIEAGGFSPERSSILSISYSKNKQIHSLYASPTPGTEISTWSERNVWEPIRRVAPKESFQTERAVLSQFLDVLEGSPPETQLVGWNIGYNSTSGFDIQMLTERAKVYGLEQRYEQAFKKMNITDIGQEFAWKIATGVERHGSKLVREGVLDPDLHEQALGYIKQGRLLQEKFFLQEEEIPKYLAQFHVTKSGKVASGGAKFAGWKQELALELIGEKYQAHISSEDVRGMKKVAPAILQKGIASEETIRKWSPLALRKSLVSSALYRPLSATERTPDRYLSILERARAAEAHGGTLYRDFTRSFEEELAEKVGAAGEDLSEIKLGRGLSRPIQKVRRRGAASFLSKQGWRRLSKVVEGGFEHIGKHRIGAGLGAAALGLWALQPGQWFSGRDDEYNIIRGLAHGGVAQEKRREMTDFGSGYQGLPESLMGQSIDPRILRERVRHDEDASLRWEIEEEIREKQREAQKEMGVFDEGDFLSDTGSIPGLTNNEDLRQVNLSNFNIEVEDADTLLLHRKDSSVDPIHIRLSGIDAPETAGHENDPLEDVRIFQDQPLGEKASSFLRERLEGEEQSLFIDTGRKTYGRYLGVLGSDGENINLELVEEGMATALPFGDRSEDIVDRDAARYLEDEAFKDRKGVWNLKRYRALREVNEGIRRPLTHNTLTRIDKLALNLNLGAYTSFLESFDDEEGNLTHTQSNIARRMGRVLRKTHGPMWARFSGKDDAYNTIESLGHRGIAPINRRELTDFGSGYRGLISIPKALQSLAKLKPPGPPRGFNVPTMFASPANLAKLKSQLKSSTTPRGFSATATGMKAFGRFLEEQIQTSAKSSLSGKLLASHRRKALRRFMAEAEKYGGEEIAVINPRAIKELAKKEGVPYSKALKGTIAHERFHQRMAKSGLRGELDIDVPTEWRAARYPVDKPSADVAEEYVAHMIEAKYMAPTNVEAARIRKMYEEDILPAFEISEGVERLPSTMKGTGTDFGSPVKLWKAVKRAGSWLKKSKPSRASLRSTPDVHQELRDRIKGLSPGESNFAINANDLPSLSTKQIKETLGISAGKSPSAPTNVAETTNDWAFGVMGSGFGPGEAAASGATKGSLSRQNWEKIDDLVGDHKSLRPNVADEVSKAERSIEATNAGRKNIVGTEDLTNPGRKKPARQQVARESQILKFKEMFPRRTFKENWHALHKRAQIQSSVNGHRPGRRHTQAAGKLVI